MKVNKGAAMSKTIEEAFEEWSNKPEAEAATRHELFKKCFAAGVAHGEAREREAVLAIIREARGSKAVHVLDALNAAERRIRQRGEKGDG